MNNMRTPKYEQVAEAIAKQITLGKYPVGSMLPPEPELEKEYKVSRATVRNAMQILLREGLVSIRQGRGTKVLHTADMRRFASVTSLSETVRIKGEDALSLMCVVKIDEVRIPSDEDARFLHLEPGSKVYRLQRIMKKGEVVYGITTNYLPESLAPGLPEYEGQFMDLYSFLEKQYGIKYTKADESIYAVSAGLLEAQIMDIPVNTPLLRTRRTAYCNFGPMECSYYEMRSDIYSIHIHMSNE